MLTGKNILLGVTGSIAAYKSVDLARRLRDEGAGVTVVMTDAACRFITPIVLEAASGNPVHTNLFEGHFRHISLVKDINLLLVAPATANTINKFACGIADNLLCSIWLAYEGPALIAPAMNSRMYRNPIVKKSISALAKSGITIIGPETGGLACGETGPGRMSEINSIIEASIYALTPKDLSGHSILVTAGPTREPLDPVRFLSNRSSGKMGFAIARAACRRGADVTLVSGPSSQTPPEGISFIPVESSAEMESAVLKNLSRSSALIMAAAVCDFTPGMPGKSKIAKKDKLFINLKETPDIVKRAAKKKGSRIVVGFAAETGSGIEKAKDKLKNKHLDLIVLNDVTRKGAGFDSDTNIVTLIDREGKLKEHPLMRKDKVANIILDEIKRLCRQ